MDSIVGGRIATGGVVKLNIDSDKVGYIFLPNQTVLTTVTGVIYTTYTGVGGRITYYVPKNTTEIDVSSSSLSGVVTYNGTASLYCFATLITSLTVLNSEYIDAGQSLLFTNLITPKAVYCKSDLSALTAKSIGDILYAAYIDNRKNVVYDFSGGTNAGTTDIGIYTLAAYGMTLGQLDNPLVADGGTVLYNTI